MNNSFTDTEARLIAGDLIGASNAFAELRPCLKDSLAGLKLLVRIHFAAKRWERVDVVCRLLRNEFPADPTGFTQSAESLHQQGRNSEALSLLHATPAARTEVQPLIERYQTSLVRTEARLV